MPAAFGYALLTGANCGANSPPTGARSHVPREASVEVAGALVNDKAPLRASAISLLADAALSSASLAAASPMLSAPPHAASTAMATGHSRRSCRQFALALIIVKFPIDVKSRSSLQLLSIPVPTFFGGLQGWSAML